MTTTQDLIFTIRLDDGSMAEARALDPAAAARLRKVVGAAGAERKRLRVRAVPEADTSGHLLADDTVEVNIALEYDVEGHTFALRLPSADEARRLQKRLLLTGVIAASIAVGAAGAELAGQQARSQAQGAPAGAPAITAPGPALTAPYSIDQDVVKPRQVDLGAPGIANPDAGQPSQIDADGSQGPDTGGRAIPE